MIIRCHVEVDVVDCDLVDRSVCDNVLTATSASSEHAHTCNAVHAHERGALEAGRWEREVNTAERYNKER